MSRPAAGRLHGAGGRRVDGGGQVRVRTAARHRPVRLVRLHHDRHRHLRQPGGVPRLPRRRQGDTMHAAHGETSIGAVRAAKNHPESGRHPCPSVKTTAADEFRRKQGGSPTSDSKFLLGDINDSVGVLRVRLAPLWV